MKWSELTIARLACACFFICPGITYGVLTSRLPALKAQTGASDGQIGMFLLSLGGASLIALFSSSWLISQWNSRVVLKTGTALLLVSTILAGVCHEPLQLTGVFIVYGLGTGLVDVSMNVQGLLVERRYKEPSMSLMHAFFSLGVILGALSGSLFAALEIPYLLNALCALVFMPVVYLGLLEDFSPRCQWVPIAIEKAGRIRRESLSLLFYAV